MAEMLSEAGMRWMASSIYDTFDPLRGDEMTKPLGPHKDREPLWARGLVLWMQGESEPEIGRRLGVTQQAVAYQARKRHWPRRGSRIDIIPGEYMGDK